MEVDREHVLAYRVRAQGLDRAVLERGPAVLDLGVQDNAGLAARLALAARTPADHADGLALALAWSWRGAPHVHRATELRRVAEALWPLSDADALARLVWQRARLADVGGTAVEVVATVAASVRAVVTRPMSKPEASAAISADLPPRLVLWCEPCGSRHVPEQALRVAALAAGVALELDTYPARLTPIDGWPGVPDANHGITDVIRAYLRLLGPATRADVAGYLGSTAGALREVWPDDLTEVSVAGRRSWLPADAVDALADAPAPRLTRLLPPSDPWVQARDREITLPDTALHKRVWKSIQPPGTVLVDGEIVGTWRAKASGAALALTVTPFDTMTVTDELAAEAARVAAVRGHDTADVRIG